MKQKIIRYTPLLAVILLGAIIRLAYIFLPVVPLTVDESTYGIQAIHILKGERPVFYYAQPFTGSQSAYLVAVLFWCFGFYPILLKLIPFAFSLAFIVTTFFVARRAAQRLLGSDGRLAGLAAAALVAIPPVFMANWSVRAGSGYPEATLLGSLCLLVVFSIFWPVDAGIYKVREEANKFFLLGLLGGFGYWVQPAIAYFLVPIFAFLVVWGCSRLVKSFRDRTLNKVILFLLIVLLAALLGFVLGASPVISYNLRNDWLTNRSLLHKPAGTKAAFVNFFRVGLPPLLGTRSPWSDTDYFKPLAITIWSLYGISFFHLLWRRRHALSRYLRLDFSVAQPVDLLLACTFIVPFIFSFSPYNWFLTEPRYIYGLYGSLPILLALWASSLGKKTSWLIIFLVLVSNCVGMLWLGSHSRPNSFESPLPLDKVISFLKEHNIHFIYSSDRLCHRLIYESNEDLICTQWEGGFGSVRYPAYIDMVHAAPKGDLAFVFLVGEEWADSDTFTVPLGPCIENLDEQNNPCREEIIDGVFRISLYR